MWTGTILAPVLALLNYHFLWETWNEGKGVGKEAGEGRVLQYRR